MSTWDEFSDQRRRAIERFVNGDPDPYKLLWSHADDVTIFGGSEERSSRAARFHQQAFGLGGPWFREGACRNRQPRGGLQR